MITQETTNRIEYLCERLANEERLIAEQHDSWPSEALGLDGGGLGFDLLAARRFRGKRAEQVYRVADAVVRVNFTGGECTVVAWGRTPAAAADAAAEVRKRVPTTVIERRDIQVTFWSNGRNGPSSSIRKLDAPAFDDVMPNYAASTRVALERLHGFKFDAGHGGKLILWHGEPGTGKTFALRALARSWRDWLKIHYVIDPDAFFGTNASYLRQVLLSDDDDDFGDDIPCAFDCADPTHDPRRKRFWRLIVLEDTGELLTKDAKERSGQGLSRLLNVADGLVGQGLRVLVLVTTNEDLGTLHPAVTRPGRCISNVTFMPLSYPEAEAWLRARGKTPPYATHQPVTLADLYAMASGEIAAPTSRRFGVGG